jgi:hypothetical protein
VYQDLLGALILNKKIVRPKFKEDRVVRIEFFGQREGIS